MEQLELFSYYPAPMNRDSAYDRISDGSTRFSRWLTEVAEALMLVHEDRRAASMVFRLSADGWAGTGPQLADIARHLAATDVVTA